MGQNLKSQGEYLFHNGLHCPKCDAEELCVNGGIAYSEEIKVPIRCLSCGLDFVEVYTLSGYSVDA